MKKTKKESNTYGKKSHTDRKTEWQEEGQSKKDETMKTMSKTYRNEQTKD